MKQRMVSLVLLLLMPAAFADHQHMDDDLVWPLCGRISENPPMGWVPADGCPADRQGNPDHTDAPFSSTYGPRLLFSGGDRYDFHRGVDIATPIGTPFFAIADGRVDHAGQGSFSDPHMKVRHYRPGHNTCGSGGGCYFAMYLHINSWVVNDLDNVVKGQLLGYTGESGSGFDHLHWEIRDAPDFDTSSAWQRDTIHPFTGLPYNELNNTGLTFNSVDDADPNSVDASVRVFGNRYDLLSIEMTVLDANQQEVVQAGNTPNAEGYHVNPPFWDMETWSFEYSHKDSGSVPWEMFAAGGALECPYLGDHTDPMEYSAHYHMDKQDPGDMQQGLFNGVHVTTNKYWLVGTREYEVNVEFRELQGPAECIIADAVFSTGVISSARWGTCPSDCTANRDITPNQWESFSLPCDPGSNRTVAGIFDDLIPGQYNARWVVYRFDAKTTSYHKMALDERMWEGEGYWIYTLDPSTIDYAGHLNPANHQPLQSDPDDGKQNFLGSVFNTMVPWQSVMIENDFDSDNILVADTGCDLMPVGGDCQVSRVMQKWSGSNFDAFNGVSPGLEGEINPADAIWVRSYRPGSRLNQPDPAMPAPASISYGPAKEPGKKKLEDWYIRLVASSGNKRDRGNILGQLGNSIDGPDGNDLQELRPFGGSYLSLVFDNPLFPEVDWGYTSDFRAVTVKPRGRWPFLVRSSADVSDITLTWEGMDHLFRSVHLQDEQSGEVIRIKPGGSYTFAREGGGNRFTLLVRQ